MISKDKHENLVKIYFYICDKFKKLQFYCERFSNDSESAFTDQEIMTLYLYTMHPEGHTKIKHIHRFASDWHGISPKVVFYSCNQNLLRYLPLVR